jgi:triosephosphate isomerase (TIM)
MVTRKKIIVGNWKMNLNTHEASLFLHKLASNIKPHRDVEVVLAPTLLALQSLSLQIDRKQFKLAVQNLYWRDHGAYTGEVSATQLHGVVDYAIIGHSERRHIFGETDKDIRHKVQAAIRNKIKPILCIGETATERADGETNDVIHDQLLGGLANLTAEELDDVTVAYEPVWAIGTGKSAKPADLRDAVKAIRRQLAHLYGDAAAETVRVLYGGSVNSSNAVDYLDIEGVDGLLIGGASLEAHIFADIIKNVHDNSDK